MKVVKYLITIVVFFFCFALNGELYQSHLQSFSNNYFYLEIENKNREEVYSAVLSAAEKYHETVFAIERIDINAFCSQISIYATKTSQEKLISEQNIVDGKAHSLFSGTTEVVFFPLETVIGTPSIIRFYFSGSKNTVSDIRQDINSKLASSYIHKEKGLGSDTLFYWVWALTFGFILLLTWLDIQFDKKAIFLKVSMGSSIYKLVGNSIITDLILYSLIMAASFFILWNKIFVSYKLNFIFLSFVIFCFFNSFLYITYFKRDYKQIIYGANISGQLLSNAYLLKALVMIMLVASLSYNFTVIEETVTGLKPYKKIEKIVGYNTLIVIPQNTALKDETDKNKIYSRLFFEAYIQDKVLLATSCADLDEPIIVLNKAALTMVVANPEQFQNDTATFTVCIPEEKAEKIAEDDIEFALSTTSSEFFGLKDYSSAVKYYRNTDVIYFDLRSVSVLPYGYQMLDNPVIVYCNISNDQLLKAINDETIIEHDSRWANIFFNVNDMSIFSEDATKSIDTVSFTSLIDQCAQHKINLMRTMLITSILSVFLLILCILLISVIVKMEYMINSKELALKKILGYSLIRRNIAIILLNIFAVLIAFITGLILSRMYEYFNTLTLYAVCLFVLSLDTILILCNMAVAEKKNTAHILKGGSL